MNKFGYAAALAAALTIEGCVSTENCHISGGDIENIDGPLRALEICNTNRKRVLKCVKSEEGQNGDLVPVTVNCADDNYHDQLSKAFNGDYTICNAGVKPNEPTVDCD